MYHYGKVWQSVYVRMFYTVITRLCFICFIAYNHFHYCFAENSRFMLLYHSVVLPNSTLCRMFYQMVYYFMPISLKFKQNIYSPSIS